MTIGELGAGAAREIASVLAGVDDLAAAALRVAIREADAVATYGVGREGLVLRGLAMRLYHLGFPAFVVGDMTARPLGPGGLFICSAGPGTFATVAALVGVVRTAGARVALFTANASSPLSDSADVTIRIPAQTMAGGPASNQLMGSIYEQSLWVLGDAIVDLLVADGELDRAAIVRRHTNLE